MEIWASTIEKSGRVPGKGRIRASARKVESGLVPEKWKSGRVPEKIEIWASTREGSRRVPGKVGSERVSEKVKSG